MIKIRIKIEGPRPPYYHLSDTLWPGVSIDSDGDSVTPDASDWTELTIINREDETQRIDIDPESEDPLILIVRSEVKELAEFSANFLVKHSEGTILSLHKTTGHE